MSCIDSECPCNRYIGAKCMKGSDDEPERPLSTFTFGYNPMVGIVTSVLLLLETYGALLLEDENYITL